MTPYLPFRLTQPAGWFEVSWQRRDQHRLITYLAVVGVLIAAAMAFLGLPPVDLHGPLHRFGILAVLGATAVTIRTLIGALARRWITAQIEWTPTQRRAAILTVLALIVALEIRQQLRADLLIAGT